MEKDEMSMNEKVSVIIPFYNSKEYLRASIIQLQKQSYSNIELLLIDDGSTDGGEAEIEDLIDNEIVFYYYLPHQGVSVARNKGIEEARGKYISFIDVDDIPKEDYIETLVYDIKSKQCDAVICNFYEFDNDKEEIKSNISDMPWKNQVIHRDEIDNVLIPNMISADSGYTIKCTAWRMLVSRKFILENHLKFQPGIEMAEDLLFTLQLYHRCNSIYIESDFLYGYRQSIGSTMHRYKPNAFADSLQYQSALKKFLTSEKIYKKNKERYERQYLRIYTFCISNAARNIKLLDTYREVKKICQNFKQDQVMASKEHKWNIALKITFWLLRYRCAFTLSVLYRIKEKIRLRKLC
ncbi:glycosyltransferase family 2 protein [Lactobacillus delbrueckii subsp. bulgaricus]